jgi:hypothetical protein
MDRLINAEIVLAGVAVAVLLLMIVWQTVVFHRERGRLMRHNDELLNRLMSRDFAEYAAGSRALPSNWRDIRDYVSRRGKEDKDAEGPEAEKDDGLGIPVV